MPKISKSIDIAKKTNVSESRSSCRPSFFNIEKKTNTSILFSRGKRIENFFTEDSKLYLTNKELEMIGKGFKLNRKLKGWDSLSSKIVADYRKENLSEKDYLYNKFVSTYESMREEVGNVSSGITGQFSVARVRNFAFVASILFGMFSMTMIYRYLGQGVFAKERLTEAVTGDQIVQSIEIESPKTSEQFVALASDMNGVEVSGNEKDQLEKKEITEEIDDAKDELGGVKIEPEQDGGVEMYTVKSGDTVSDIAKNHDITINTILWANDIDNIDSIKPGDVIFILPTSGVIHKVAEGDSMDSIAARYKADKERILSFNGLLADSVLEIGKEIIIPDGQGEGSSRNSQKEAMETVELSDNDGSKILEGEAGTGHKFPYGYCTWYVAQKRYVPWSGNAGTWLYHAKSMGYKTGKTPKEGAIIVTTEDGYYGHVAMVEKVSGDDVTISEMNFTGWAKKSRRTISASNKVIRGYIY